MNTHHTKEGRIILSQSAYTDIVLASAESFTGKLMFSTPGGNPVATGYMKWISSDFMSAEYIEQLNMINLKIYVVMKFGISLSDTLSEFSDCIRKNIKNITGTEVGRIKFHVTGVKSKKLVHRNIEFIF